MKGESIAHHRTNIERALSDVEDALARLRLAIHNDASGLSDLDRWRRILTLVEQRGGRVTVDEWRELGEECGYHPSGLGGFFRGENASMRAEGDYRVLTEQGIANLDEYGRLD